MRRFLFLSLLLAVASTSVSATLLFVVNRGTSVFSPASIPNLRVWADPSDAATVTSSGGLLTSWADKSGNGNTMTPATLIGATAPSYPGTTVNGLATMSFTNATKQCATLTSSVSAPYTIAAVVRTTAIVATGQSPFSGVSRELMFIYSPASIIEVYDGTNYVDFTETATSGNTYFYVLTTDGTVAGTHYYRSNVARGITGSSGTNFTAASIAVKHIGCSAIGTTGNAFSSALIGEFQIYSRVITGQEMLDLYTYEKAKWATQ